MNLKSLNSPKCHIIISVVLGMISIHSLWVEILVGNSNSLIVIFLLQCVKLLMINLEKVLGLYGKVN